MEERRLWKNLPSHVPDKTIWRRGSLRLKVAPSQIHGYGTFTHTPLSAGQFLGRFSGRVLCTSDSDKVCEAFINRHEVCDDRRLLILRKNGAWAVVDSRGSVFEWLNHQHDAYANVNVTETGELYMVEDACCDDELTWDYGPGPWCV